MIEESDQIKIQICNECKNHLKGTFSDEELEEFVIAFMTAAEGYIFKRKRGKSGG